MFATLKVKLYALAAFIGLFMFGWIKHLSAKNKRLEHENKVNNKIKEIREDQEEYREEVLIDEKKAIDKKVKVNPDNLDDYLNGL